MNSFFRIAIFILPLILSPQILAQDSIQWLSVEELEVANATSPKPVFFDIFTDWCGWCKKMDKSTFRDPRVVKLLNEEFHPVKFNAEQRQGFTFMDHDFKFVQNGNRGYNELAAALLDNAMSFPSFVALNEKFERITIVQGYHKAESLLPILRYIAEKHYLDTTWKEYKNSKRQ